MSKLLREDIILMITLVILAGAILILRREAIRAKKEREQMNDELNKLRELIRKK